MPITINADDLNLKSTDWDHLLTEHGLEGCNAAMKNGWKRKSKWLGNEDEIKSRVNAAFDLFRQRAIQNGDAQGEVTLNQDGFSRTVFDVTTRDQVGTDVSGEITRNVRLVMEIKHSGDTVIVTAFPF